MKTKLTLTKCQFTTPPPYEPACGSADEDAPTSFLFPRNFSIGWKG